MPEPERRASGTSPRQPERSVLKAVESTSVGLPRGSKDPNSRVLDPKIHTMNGFLSLQPYYLGTWTVRVGVGAQV